MVRFPTFGLKKPTWQPWACNRKPACTEITIQN